MYGEAQRSQVASLTPTNIDLYCCPGSSGGGLEFGLMTRPEEVVDRLMIDDLNLFLPQNGPPLFPAPGEVRGMLTNPTNSYSCSLITSAS